MATVINNPTDRERVVESDSGGWAVAIIVLLAVIAIGAFVWMRYGGAAPAATDANTNTPGANINVTLPTGGTDNSSGEDSSGGTNQPNPAQ